MNHPHRLIASLLLGVSCCIGCAGRSVPDSGAETARPERQTMVGSWHGSLGCMASVRTFSADGTYVASLLGTASDAGTWEIRDGTLTLSYAGRSTELYIISQDAETVKLVANNGELPMHSLTGPWTWRRVPAPVIQ